MDKSLAMDSAYVDSETGTYIMFKPNGHYYYAFEPEDKEAYRSKNRTEIFGNYWFSEEGEFAYNVNISTHAGLFELSFSDDSNILYVTYMRYDPPRRYELKKVVNNQ